jgi:putative toxin-antitoxin system antitoxin component (TIGR02293 family)
MNTFEKDRNENEKVNRLEKIYAFAVEVLEDKQQAIQWLNTPKIPLGGLTPLSLLDSAASAQDVKHLLERIEYGVLS